MYKPYFLVDLDDTLFQTKRKILLEANQTPFSTAAIDKKREPRSFMTQEQANFVEWLLKTALLIPVTARGTEEISRVTIPFNSWKITTHGAVIINPDGYYDKQWKTKILSQLEPYQEKILHKQKILTHAFENTGIDAWARINYEYNNTAIYLVAKHRDSTKIQELYSIADKVDAELGLEGFYIHRNDNNIAWLPKCIQKGKAAQFLIEQLRGQCEHTPIIGLGDSLSDYSFLRLCTWFGMPKQSQLSEIFNQHIVE